MPSLYLIVVLFNPFVHFMLSFCSHALTLPISFIDIIRILVAGEVETRVAEARHERDVLIRCLISLSVEEADVSFVR